MLVKNLNKFVFHYPLSPFLFSGLRITEQESNIQYIQKKNTGSANRAAKLPTDPASAWDGYIIPDVSEFYKFHI